MLASIEEVTEHLTNQRYVADEALSTAVYLTLALGKPLLIEGRAGVGKTEVAKVLVESLGTNLIRLQCYEGLDASAALYEWNYAKQILRIKMEERGERSAHATEEVIFSRDYLLQRPLLQAISQPDRAPVLLIDEIDRADEEFEAFLLEVLSDFQVTIPELGTIKATHRPHVIVTSNRVRELSDALRRRCLYIWIDNPEYEKELQIVKAKVPGISGRLAEQICRFMQSLRRDHWFKTPGTVETLDWALALLTLHKDHIDRTSIEQTLGCIFKDSRDIRHALDGRLESALAGAAVRGDGERSG